MKFKDDLDFRLKAQACGQMLGTLTVAGVLCLAYACGWVPAKEDNSADKAAQERVKSVADSVPAPQKHNMYSVFQKVR
ncbi:MAG: hypothetical protein K2L25_03060 [Alphaproteobacteria bacterium]|nr:hypothetical protein [Alphaproteobacteria bacterium]